MATLSKHRPVKRNAKSGGQPAKGTSVAKRGNRFWIVLAAFVVAGLGIIMALNQSDGTDIGAPPQIPTDYQVTGSISTTQGPPTLETIPFNGQRAYDHLVAICEIGPRKSGSEGMLRQQQMLKEHFTSIGGKVEMQEFTTTDPNDRSPVTMANMIVTWHPDRKERILLCAHYDTRPFPDRDPTNPRGVFIGANDGASGTALLCEMGRHMPTFESKYGVDFVLFDGEELVYNDRRDRSRYFMGSKYFASWYVRESLPYRYRGGVLLDMVGDKELHLFQERNSLRWPDTRPMVRDIWAIAAKLGVSEFVARPGHEVRDDHLPLRNTARIPTLDIIDFDYPRPGGDSYWHTTEDTADKCSALSLAKVGWVVHEWLKALE